MLMNYNDEYKIAKVLRIDKELNELPNLHRGGNGNIVRLYGSDNKVKRTYSLNNPKNLSYAEQADRRQRLIEIRKLITSSLKVNADEYHIEMSAGYKIRKSDWDKMKSQSHPRPVKGDLWFENLHMRSRFEVNTAIILRSLDLEFKYEPEIIINGKVRYPDFVVYLPEFEVCFIIECMGRTGDADYDRDAVNKLESYMNGGLIPYRDFLVLGGNSDYIPAKDWVTNSIVSLVNNIACECVMPNDSRIVVTPVIPFFREPELMDAWDFEV